MIKKTIGHKLGLVASSLALIAGLGVSQSAVASDPLLGEIKMVGFGFAPRGYAKCDGQLLPIAQNSALFSLLGTTYGGDGRTTFGLPDLRGRVAIHPGEGPGLSEYRWGQKGGVEMVTLNTSQIPSHNHSASTTVDSIDATLNGIDSRGDKATPGSHSLASKSRTNIYSSSAPNVAMHADSISATGTASTTVNNTGGNQAHENRMPYLSIYHVIATVGIFPSRS